LTRYFSVLRNSVFILSRSCNSQLLVEKIQCSATLPPWDSWHWESSPFRKVSSSRSYSSHAVRGGVLPRCLTLEMRVRGLASSPGMHPRRRCLWQHVDRLYSATTRPCPPVKRHEKESDHRHPALCERFLISRTCSRPYQR
jgi:hypothetical protein